MNLSDFDYELPEALVAQEPSEPREDARMLVHRVAGDATEHLRIRDLPEVLARGDLLVVNDTRVRPARLLGKRVSGGAVELLVLGPGSEPGRWLALTRPAGRIRVGESIELEGGALRARACARGVGPRGAPGAEWRFEIQDPSRPDVPLEDLLEEIGRMPLPPYIRRQPTEDPRRPKDRHWYQTVFAREMGAVAAPTAGLHFTAPLLDRLRERGVERTEITLHVGQGTFEPVAVERIEEHVMHAESYRVSASARSAVEQARARGNRVLAVGTTSARALESTCDASGTIRAGSGETRLFITPGYRFRAVDALLTNFHLPRSTLLMLVSAFLGRERTLRLYREAIERGYRFYSYGDAMLLL